MEKKNRKISTYFETYSAGLFKGNESGLVTSSFILFVSNNSSVFSSSWLTEKKHCRQFNQNIKIKNIKFQKIKEFLRKIVSCKFLAI